MMYRVRVTDLDAFDWYLNMDQSLEEFRRRLMRLDPPTEPMLRGTAFHAMMEHARAGDEIDQFEKDGFTFKVAGDLELELDTDGYAEVLGSKMLNIDGMEVRLSGRVDYVSPRAVTEFKTTGKLNLERYMSSYQWRCYLEMFERDIAEYVIFTVRKNKRTGIHMIYDCDPLTLRRYPGMGDDVERKVRDFVWFIQDHVPEYGKSSSSSR